MSGAEVLTAQNRFFIPLDERDLPTLRANLGLLRLLQLQEHITVLLYCFVLSDLGWQKINTSTFSISLSLTSNS